MAMDMHKMLKQVQKMQADMEKAQDEIAQQQFEASAGGGAVKVVVGGDLRVLSVEIDKEAATPEDVDMLQDMVKAAANDALQQAQDATNDRMGALAGGLNIPGLM